MIPSPHNTRYLLLLTFTATLGGFLFGFDTAVISGVIPYVRVLYHMDALLEGSFVGSALAGCILGVSVSGWMGNRLGRRPVMLLSALLFALSAIGCTFAGNAYSLIFFRLIGGIGIGAASVISPMYISELAPSNLRGRMVTYYQLAITIGILAAYFSNAIIQPWRDSTHNFLFREEIWRYMFAVSAIPAILFIVMSGMIPESPRWLAMRGKYAAAQAITEKISGPEAAVREMAMIRSALSVTQVKLKDMFKSHYRQALLIGILLAALSQFSGINAVIYYGPSLLEQAGFGWGQALGGQVTIGIVNMLFTLVATYSIDRYGRRPLLLWGIGGAVLSLMATAWLFSTHLTSGWLLLLPIMLFIACFAFSFGPVTWVIINEIFPVTVRSSAIALATMSLWIANWIVGQFFPLLLLHAGPALTFLIFAVCSASAFWLTWKKIPETKGMSLEEINGVVS
ncbi:sugar porter family MFS transporter [Chitinophaga pendula]|uniref:sugar porter family MFS transporter n=1 Tax=Chitinophaga TaxID=79328 RepID=UPI000BB04473|nr:MULTISPECIES: sugar porter family MFS transporter [Chitinophaga]ASZ12119.1 MFS transporter [Chitinophaga sp. MD30]UCJ04842.1 sugar porter family MFS transporter [Chitinophaga pendula]